jgi:hypothetical protein
MKIKNKKITITKKQGENLLIFSFYITHCTEHLFNEIFNELSKYFKSNFCKFNNYFAKDDEYYLQFTCKLLSLENYKKHINKIEKKINELIK